MDLRKAVDTSPAGTLRLLRNAMITPGAEIVKREAWVRWANVSAATKGLLEFNGALYVVIGGTTGSIVAGTPGVITLPTGGVAITEILDWDIFNTAFFICAQLANGVVNAYYNQVEVVDVNAQNLHFCRTYRSKMYGLELGRILRFSDVGNPMQWTAPSSGTSGNGAGFIDLSAEDADSTRLVALEAYYDRVAIFSEHSSQLWGLDPDPTKNEFKQLLRQAGCIARHTVCQYGPGDVIYLSPSGLRSLRARDIANTASVTDLGTPIDPVVQPLIAANYGTGWFTNARTLLQPRSGRVWLVLPDRIYVLSTFQEPTVTAWSVFDPPAGTTINHSVTTANTCFVRCEDGYIYAYGNADGTGPIYDTVMAEVVMPFLSIDTPGEFKTFGSIDVACTGSWAFSMCLEPTNATAEEVIGTYVNSTFNGGEMSIPGHSTHISLRARTTDASAATLGKVLIHYSKSETG
jgi:hypothetical protein